MITPHPFFLSFEKKSTMNLNLYYKANISFHFLFIYSYSYVEFVWNVLQVP